MAVSTYPAILAHTVDVDDGQDDDDDNDDNNNDHSSSDDCRSMRRRMPSGRYGPFSRRYRLEAGAFGSQYPRVVSISRHRREFGI